MRSEPVDDDRSSTVRCDLDLEHDVDDVWRLLADSVGLERWLGAGSSIDARPGGALDVNDVETGVRRRGVVDQVDPGARIAWRWWPVDEGDGPSDGSDPDATTAVELVLTPTPSGTRVTVVESRAVVEVSAATTGTPTAMAGAASATATAWGWRGLALAMAAATATLAPLAR